MRASYGIGQLSAAEKSDILNQHKSVYNGYQTMQPKVSNTQPLYVYDPAGDKDGLVVNNKGEVKKYTNFGINEEVEEKSMCEQCGGQMTEGECMECGQMYEMEEETGHLDDIYKERDLNLSHGDFDYVEGGGNDYGTFEGMHKNLYKEDDIIDDDGFEDIELSTDELGEQGGNVDDMDTDSVEPAYDFESEGPGGVYPVNEYDDEEVEYERMESAWADDEIKEQGWGTVARIAAPIVIDYAIDKLSNEGEIGEVDVSGSQGIYGDMDPAYDFDSDGPGSAGPYQRFSYNEDEDEEENDFGFATHNGDFDGDDSEDEWEEIDTDLQEDFKTQKNKISEMFNRMSRYN
jgi:hypothetical protein